MKKLITQTVMASILILLFGCKKEGPAGKDGKDGKDGNANVKSTTITFSNWNWDATNNYEYSDQYWSGITSTIVNSGGVFVYVSTSSGWVALPRVIYPSTSYSESQRIVYNTGTLRIIVQDSDLTQPAALSAWTIKIVAVESSGFKANPHLNWNNYDEVKKEFQLTE